MTNGEPGPLVKGKDGLAAASTSGSRIANASPAQGWVIVADGQRLRALRRQRELSQEMLAARAGLSPGTIARLEGQATPSCRGRTLARLATALGACPVDMLPGDAKADSVKNDSLPVSQMAARARERSHSRSGGATDPSEPGGCPRAVSRDDGGPWPVLICDLPVVRVVEMIPVTRRLIRDVAAAVAGCSQVGGDVELMASELLTNAVQHGSGETMRVRVQRRGQVVRVEVHHAGRGSRPASPDRDPMGERGRGLLLVAALSRRWGLERDGEGTTAWFEARIGDQRG